MHPISQRSQVLVTEDNYGPVIGIVSIICLTSAILCVCGRIYTKALAIRKVDKADYVVFLALGFLSTQTIMIVISSFKGLGKHWENLSATHQVLLMKMLYIAGLLSIPTLVVTKISVIIFIQGLGPAYMHKRIGYIFGALLLLWGIASELAVAFQCHLPQPWKVVGHRCINILWFWNTFSLINIVTDVLLVLWPVMIIYNLQTKTTQRLFFMALFGARLFVVAAVIVQIILTKVVNNSTDLSFDLWPMFVCVQIILTTSIVTACIPYMFPFLRSLESGFLKADGLSMYSGRTSNGKPISRKRGKSSLGSGINYRLRSPKVDNQADSQKLVLHPMEKNAKTVVHGGDKSWTDTQSTTSQSRIIRYERSWGIGFESRSSNETGLKHETGEQGGENNYASS